MRRREIDIVIAFLTVKIIAIAILAGLVALVAELHRAAS